jgi:glycoprotein-N-acetylgalactosamine 3-beta-galactosyltransferase
LTAASGAAAAAAADRGRRRPSVPLREECLDVVRRAGPPVDLAYEDVTGGHVDHPHLGATYEDGTTFGYVPDVGALRRDPPPFRLGGGGDGEEALLARACSTRDSDNKVLTEKVFVDLSASAATWPNEGGPGGPPPPERILCLVYTIEPHHSRLPAIRETWGYVHWCSPALCVVGMRGLTGWQWQDDVFPFG